MSLSGQEFGMRARAARPHLQRVLTGAQPSSPQQELAAITEEAAGFDSGQWDRYGDGGPVERIEARVAELLGKPSAVMFPSGVMAQQAVLRVWADRNGCRAIALPDLSHLLHHEQDGPQLLHGFRWERLSRGPHVPTAAELAKVPTRLGAVLVELPLRDAGYLLPTWEELVELSAACRARGVPLHLDGARLWESAAGLGRSLEAVAALADSVYVSLYKGLGGLAGALVAGPQDVLDEVRLWRTRQGGTLVTMAPYALAGLRGLRELLPRMPEFHDRALHLAEALLARGIRVSPDPPHVNAFRIFVPGEAADLDERLLRCMEERRVGLVPRLQACDVPGWFWAELTVGPATMGWDVDEAADLLAEVLLAR